MPQPPTRLLAKIGLAYVNDQEPGIARERRGRGFCYRLPGGELLSDNVELKRIKSLGVPPAYKDVWICIDPSGHLQATGFDARGRKQYRYHPDWHALRGETKFFQLKSFGKALPAIRRRAMADIAKQDHGQDMTLAALTLLLDAAYLRVGNRSYLETNGTYGATTLLKRHVSFGETIELRFAAKGGQKVKRQLRHPRLQKSSRKSPICPARSCLSGRTVKTGFTPSIQAISTPIFPASADKAFPPRLSVPGAERLRPSVMRWNMWLRVKNPASRVCVRQRRRNCPTHPPFAARATYIPPFSI